MNHAAQKTRAKTLAPCDGMAAAEDGIGSGTDDRWFRREAFFGVVLISVVSQPSCKNSSEESEEKNSLFVDFQNRCLPGQLLKRRKEEESGEKIKTPRLGSERNWLLLEDNVFL